jgi:hypothetical protein
MIKRDFVCDTETSPHKTCASCSWGDWHSADAYGFWRCKYHGFMHNAPKPPNCGCEEWRREYEDKRREVEVEMGEKNRC